MSITLSEAVSALLSGSVLAWQRSGSFAAGSIQLSSPGARRVFQHLSGLAPDDLIATDESLFDGILDAWGNHELDPAQFTAPQTGGATSGPWRLKRIEAMGFGGLNTYAGPLFSLDVDGENWCLEGYNGSGKTSLSSLILWTLTGYRSREQQGLHRDIGQREVVTNAAGKTIGSWPPLATYPDTVEELKGSATVEGKLTFIDPSGVEAFARRTVISPANGEPILQVEIDDALSGFPELIETGLLMPARIGHIGFGERSQSLYQALKMLTGLDRLATIATAASNLNHRSKRFLKYAKDNGADTLAVEFGATMERARAESENTSITLSGSLKLGQKSLFEALSDIEVDASSKAAAALAVLKSEVSETLDLSKAEDRARLNTAVATARFHVGEGYKAVSLFGQWSALKRAHAEGFSNSDSVISTAESALATALDWHDKQSSDEKLRLKALAAKYFVPVEDLSKESNCPLCDSRLSTEQQKDLAQELNTLRGDAEVAERGIVDACRDISENLSAHIPGYLKPLFPALSEMVPNTAFAETIRARFSTNLPYDGILSGIAFLAENVAKQAETTLPSFIFEPPACKTTDVAAVIELQQLISDVARVSSLAKWWSQNSAEYASLWNSLIGVQDSNGSWPLDSIEGKIEILEEAIAGSEPLDKIAKFVGDAKKVAADWNEINRAQKLREEIAESIEPLKDLQKLVDCETHRTIETLSARVGVILQDIRLKDRFAFESTVMTKKAITIEGSFSPGLKIDAALVANSSWLRAILWAFIFALREQAIEECGNNRFPLVVLDDPQTTFDPKNKRKWAEMIVGLANLARTDPKGMQLFLATHERQFYDVVCQTVNLNGQKGEMAGPTKSSPVAHIVNGTFLERQFAKAAEEEDDVEGYIYVQQVRVYCEDLLRIMLRPESYEISGNSLGKLNELLSTLRSQHISPYNRSAFLKLTNALNESNASVMKVINNSKHTYDGTIGYAQAEDVKAYWDSKLQKAFIHAFRLAADYDAYGGMARLVDWQDNVVQLPNGHKEQIKGMSFANTGIAAAAESDGLIVGDGQIAIDEWKESMPLTLHNHSAYRLNAGTLDPVASIGDILLVQNFGTPGPRNLVVGAYGENLYARRLNETEDHTEIVTLTGQGSDPYNLPQPVIAPKDRLKINKIIGTIFLPGVPLPTGDSNEVIEIGSFSIVAARLKNVKLLQVKGRSMEPIALDGQYVITRDEQLDLESVRKLNGQLVIAFDANGGVYFKRFRLHGNLVVLESANSNQSTSSEILSLLEDGPYPKLSGLRSVVGVLFDLPN